MWKQTEINIGRVKVGKEQTIKFEYDGKMEVALDKHGRQRVEASCWCSSAKVKDSTVIVKFTPSPVAKHLKLQGIDSYSTHKTITVHYTTPDSPEIKKQILTFIGDVTN